MDAKIKAMIKVIEEDADSFARRAEMYYKKRPELMKLVEEFYRAYRALAERYGHATGVLRQAHQTMAEAFPNQVPPVIVDETDPLFDPDDLQKDALGLSEGKVKKGFNFQETGEKERNLSESEVMGKFEKEIEALKDTLAKLGAEKESGLAEYQKSLERLSKLETEFSRAQEDSRGFNERATKAEGEVQTLREAINKLEAEKQAGLLQYQQCLERIANFENKAEAEAQSLKKYLASIESEKEAALDQYKQSSEMLLTQENKLLLAEEEAIKLRERADKAEREVEILKQEVAKLSEEKEATALQYQQCLETISGLEHKISCIQQEAQILNEEINSGVAKLNDAEERCLQLESSNRSLQSELESLMQQMGSQGEELTEKQKELGRFWACIQEERLRFVEAETAFKALQNLHYQTQEELRSTASELQSKALVLRDFETHNKSLQDEVFKITKKNKSLNDLNLSTSLSIKDLQNEIFNLKESKGKLEEEVELRLDQRNALQQEIYCLKEELSELNRKHQAVLYQIDAAGLSAECLELSSLSDLNIELEGTRRKMHTLEESFRALLEENSTLDAEKDALKTQLEATTDDLEKLSQKNASLENSLSDVHGELEGVKARLTSLEDTCQLLENEKSILTNEKDSLLSQKEISQQSLEVFETIYRDLGEKYSTLEKERNSTLSKVEDLEEKNQSLLIECQKLFEASKLSQQLISELERENIEQQVEVKFLSDQTNRLRMGVYELLKAFDMDLDHIYVDKTGQEEVYLSHMSSKLEDTKNSLCQVWDENQKMAIEISVLFTVLEQLRLVTKTAEMERNILERKYQTKTEQFSMLQIEADKVRGMNEEMQLELRERVQKEEVLTAEIENLHRKVLHLEGVCQNLRSEKFKVLDDKNLLAREFLDLKEKCQTLEGENLVILGEMLSLSNRSLVFKNVINDTSEKLKELVEEVDKLYGVNVAHEDNLRKMELKLEEMQLQNLRLQESLKNSEDELKNVKSTSDYLNQEIAIGKDEHDQLKSELNEAVDKLKVTEKEKSELLKVVEDLKGKIYKQEQQILKLSGDKVLLNMESGHLYKTNRELEVVLHQLKEAQDKGKIREENLFSEVQKRSKEIDHWQNEAVTVFGELQISAIFQALLKDKFHELIQAYKGLKDDFTLKDTHIELLKERIGIFEGENGGLKAQLAVYVPAIISLKGCISALENRMCIHTRLQKSHDEGVKETKIMHNYNAQSYDEECANQGALSELQDLQNRVKAVEKAVAEMERLAAQEKLNANTKLEAAMRRIEDLKFKGGSIQENVKPASEIFELENGLLMKDIVLDQMSESSFYGVRRRQRVKSESQVLESWGTAELDGSIDLTVGKGKKIAAALPERQRSRRHPSSELVVEKELGVDKLEFSRSFSMPRREISKSKIMERLNSDAQKLTNLQITVQDLKKKLELTEKGKRGKAFVECDNLKWQLEEFEEAILKLFNLNAKLAKSVEHRSFSADSNSAMESDASGNIRRRRVSEQARRASEKIGRLQFEVQKIQFVLLKMDDESAKENKGKTRIVEAKRRILLRDYLYGSIRTSNGRKKGPSCCACVQPPTNGD
ncbi:hypothetical protein NMG60_11034804 [Bertholletia excelsa]